MSPYRENATPPKRYSWRWRDPFYNTLVMLSGFTLGFTLGALSGGSRESAPAPVEEPTAFARTCETRCEALGLDLQIVDEGIGADHCLCFAGHRACEIWSSGHVNCHALP